MIDFDHIIFILTAHSKEVRKYITLSIPSLSGLELREKNIVRERRQIGEGSGLFRVRKVWFMSS